MAQLKFSQFPTTLTVFRDEHLLGVSYWDGVSAFTESQKLTWGALKTELNSALSFAADNLATANQTLTGVRQIITAGNNIYTSGSGNFGVGINPTTAKFQVNGTTIHDGTTRMNGSVAINEATAGGVALTIKGTSTSASQFIMQTYNNAVSPAFQVNNAGGVAMGAFNTVSDKNRLHVLGISGAVATDLVMVARRSTTAQGFALQENGNFGIGTELPLEKVHSTDKIRTDTVFNVNGTDGVTQTGAYTNFTIVGGIITAAS